MKKIFTLFLTAMFAVSMSATTFTFSSVNDTLQTKDGITIRLSKGNAQNAPAWNSNSSQLRLYAKNTITVTGDSLGSINLTCSKQGTKDYPDMTANVGNLVSGGTSSSTDDKVVDQWTGNAAKSVTFTLGDKGQRVIYKIAVNPGEGADTTEVEDLDGLEIDYYPSYSEAGAYNYTFLLYNSEDDDYLPMVAFDIFTTEEGSYAGTYSMDNENMGEYGYYVYGSGDEDYFYITDGEVTIIDNGEDNYTVKGWFTDGAEIYSVNVTVDGEYFNAEYPYEPEEKTTLNLVVTDGEEDDSYASDGVMYLSLTTADGELTLEYVLQSAETSTTIPDGTYSIEESEYDEEDEFVDKGYSYFEAGYYYSSYDMALGSTYQTEEENYYLVSGTVKVETTGAGKKITLSGTTYYGSTITAEYTIVGTALNEAAAAGKAEGKFMNKGQLFIQKNGVRYNAQGQAVK